MALDTIIPNSDAYVAAMALPLIDKLFFVDKVDAGVFVDYGCADGLLLGQVARLTPKTVLIGYDESEAMLERANSALPKGVLLTSDWAVARQAADTAVGKGMRSCIILSSVIHEVYAYQGEAGVEKFWQRVWGNGGSEAGFDVVTIRDTMVSRSTSRTSDPLAVARIRQIYDARMLAEWEEQWGSIGENWSLVHFLLTYRYVDNWSREIRENYLPMSLEKMMSMVPRAWEPVYIEHFVPPFLRRVVKHDFGVTLADPTHIKLVLERI